MKCNQQSFRLTCMFVFMSALLLASSGCQKTTVKLVAGNPSGSLNSPTTLATAFPILNDGEGRAENVRAISISIAGTTLTKPASLPANLGTIAQDGLATLAATFAGTFQAGNSYTMNVEGTYEDNGHSYKFALSQALRLPPASPGTATSGSSSSPAQTVNGAHFPHQAPNFPKEVNEGGKGWTVPEGPTRPAPAPSKPSGTQPAAPVGVDPPVEFEFNTSLGFNSGETPNEPSGSVNSGGVIFETANSYGSFSTNGTSFTQLDVTTIFPNNVDGGFCCDQIVQYVPSIDRFIWVMQYSNGSNGLNRYRIAAASPATVASSSGTAWTYWDITANQVDGGVGWLDYPDLSIGNSYAYLSADVVGQGHFVVRIPLSEIQSGSTINFNYTHYGDGNTAYGGHMTQNTLDTAYWGGQTNNSTVRVFSWPESSGSYSWTDVSIGSWNLGGLSSLTPDNQDWLHKLSGFPGNAILGATRFEIGGDQKGRVNELLFAWTAGSGGNFPQAQVQWVAFDLNNNYNVVSQQQIWNPNYAYAYPAFAIDANNEIGMSLEWGGGGNYENHVVGFWGDYVVYSTTSSNVGTGRYGDYTTIRPYTPDTKRMAAFGYGQQSTGFDTHYVVFSRPGQ
jgi:hypothetical protein